MAATILKFLELVDENTIVMSQGGTANYGSVSEIETENFKSLSYTDKCIHVSNHPQSKKWHCQQWPLALVNYALQHPDRTLLIIHSDPGFQIAPPAAAKAFSNLFHATFDLNARSTFYQGDDISMLIFKDFIENVSNEIDAIRSIAFQPSFDMKFPRNWWFTTSKETMERIFSLSTKERYNYVVCALWEAQFGACPPMNNARTYHITTQFLGKQSIQFDATTLQQVFTRFRASNHRMWFRKNGRNYGKFDKYSSLHNRDVPLDWFLQEIDDTNVELMIIFDTVACVADQTKENLDLRIS